MYPRRQPDNIGSRLTAIILFCLFGMDAVYYTVKFAMSALEELTNSEQINNISYYMFSASVWSELFWGFVMLMAAGLAALALRSEGFLKDAYPTAPFTLNTLRLTVMVLVLDYVVGLLLIRVLSLFSPGQEVEFVKPGYEYDFSLEMLPVDAFTSVLVAPIAEEFLFRGALFAALMARGTGPVATILISSLIFTLGHAQYEWQGLVIVFSGGVFLGLLRWITGDLRAAILCHALYNGWMVGIDYWPVVFGQSAG